VFGKGRAGQRRDSKQWNGERLIELALIDERYRYEPGRISDAKIAKMIFAKHKEFQSAETIRRRLPEARQMLELWRKKLMDIEPPEGWEEAHGDIGDDGRDALDD
jgi:hypothetical protein